MNVNLENLLPYAFVLMMAIPFLVLIKQFLAQIVELKRRELALLSGKNTDIQIKLQAYERMSIFLERLKPAYLVNKFDKELNSKEFVFLLEKSIKEEFEYNTSQQLYISDESWKDIINAKNNVLHLINKVAESNVSASLEEFKTLLLMSYLEGEDYISDGINNLKSDVQNLI